MSNPQHTFDSVTRAFLYEPTELDVLKLLKKDAGALGIDFQTHLINTNSYHPDNKGAKLIAVAAKLLDNEMIKMMSASEYKVTFKGRLYLLTYNPTMAFWSVVVGVISLFCTVWLGLIKPEIKQQNTSKPATSGYSDTTSHSPVGPASNKKAAAAHKCDSPFHVTRRDAPPLSK